MAGELLALQNQKNRICWAGYGLKATCIRSLMAHLQVASDATVKPLRQVLDDQMLLADSRDSWRRVLRRQAQRCGAA